MTTPTLFKEYIWLVNTIYRAGRISLSDINKKWIRTEMSEGVEMAPTTNATSPSASTSTSASAPPKPIWPKEIKKMGCPLSQLSQKNEEKKIRFGGFARDYVICTRLRTPTR